MFIKNEGLEVELRKEWKKWQSKAHPEDMMSFMDYVDEVDSFNGHKVKVKGGYNMEYQILFEM